MECTWNGILRKKDEVLLGSEFKNLNVNVAVITNKRK